MEKVEERQMKLYQKYESSMKEGNGWAVEEDEEEKREVYAAADMWKEALHAPDIWNEWVSGEF